MTRFEINQNLSMPGGIAMLLHSTGNGSCLGSFPETPTTGKFLGGTISSTGILSLIFLLLVRSKGHAPSADGQGGSLYEEHSPSRKPKGKGKIAAGIIMLILGILIFQFLIPQITVTPTEYREEFNSADVGTTWTIHGHLADKNTTEVSGKTFYFYTFEEDREAKISSSINLGENGDEVIVKAEKTNALTDSAEVKSSINPWIYRGAGGVLAVIGVSLLLVGSVQHFKGRKKKSEESSVNQVDLSQLIGPGVSGMEMQSTPPLQMSGTVPPQGQPMEFPRQSHQAQPAQPQMQGGAMPAAAPFHQHTPQHPSAQTAPPAQSIAPPPRPQQPAMQESRLPSYPSVTPPVSTPQYQPPPIQKIAGADAQQPASSGIPSSTQPTFRAPAPAPTGPAGSGYSGGAWTCPNCGAEVDAKYIFCTSCGYKRGG